MEKLKVTLVQSDIFWEDKEKNISLYDEKVSSITEETDIIILPEVFNSGFTAEPEKIAEEMEGPTMQWMKQKAEQKNAIVTGSLSIKENGKFFNRLIWMSPEGKYKTYDKRHLFKISDEYKTHTPGSKKLILNYKGWTICPQICFDLRFPVWSRNMEDYDLAIYISNWPAVRSHAWKSLLPARAIENQAYVIGVNRIGKGKRDEYHSGDSMVLDPKGHIIYSASHTELVQTVTLQKSKIRETREELPFLEERDSFSLLE